MSRASDNKLARCAQSAELYLRGFTQKQVAEQLDVSVDTVKSDLKKARECWRERSTQAISAMLYEQIAKIDQMERAAWLGWERSLRDAVQTTTEDIDKSESAETKLKIVRVPQAGNPAFLKVISDAIRQRCELLGLLDSETRDAITNQDYDQVVSVVIETREQWESLKPMTFDEFEQARAEGESETALIEG